MNKPKSTTGQPAQLEQFLFDHRSSIEAWFQKRFAHQAFPFYCSIDLRHAGFKLVPIDANLFPAGFNNLSKSAKQQSVKAIKTAIDQYHPQAQKVLIIPESHTRNQYYLENVATLQDIVSEAGFDTRIGVVPDEIKQSQSFDLKSGATLHYKLLKRDNQQLTADGFIPEFILLNNDLTTGLPQILDQIKQTIQPPLKLGWYTRLKTQHFTYYQDLANEFAKEFDFDPWRINPYFSHCDNVDFHQKEGLNCVIQHCEKLLTLIQKKYDDYQIKQDPFLVIKADAGTYGMAVMMTKDPQSIRQLNRKQRTRLSHIKGGEPVRRVMIQEGVYTTERLGQKQFVAEPVIYMIHDQIVGGFYRMHTSRHDDDNLNAPGMRFKPFPLLETLDDDQATERARYYSYTVIARLSLLAASKELHHVTEGGHHAS